MGQTVAVTGATGFIGRNLVKQLVTNGWQVRALVRSPAKCADFTPLPIDMITGSLEDLNSLQQLVDGVDAVVHCAGAVRGISRADFDRTNVAGVAAILKATVAQPNPPRLISLSSLAAREPTLSAYAASKRKGEDLLAQQGDALSWVALRPPAVYGPGERELLPLFQLMARGIAPILGSHKARFSMLYVDDLIGAILQCLQQDTIASGIYELDDGWAGGYDWQQLVEVAAGLRGRRILRLPVPALLLQAIAIVVTLVARLVGQAPMLTLGKVRELRHHDWVCDNRKFQQACAWEPKVGFAEGLRLTLAAAE